MRACFSSLNHPRRARDPFYCWGMASTVPINAVSGEVKSIKNHMSVKHDLPGL